MKMKITNLSLSSTYQKLSISAPAVFSVLFNLMKPLMTARTINKIQIYSSDRAKWEPEVLKLVDASQIRPRFGGCKP